MKKILVSLCVTYAIFSLLWNVVLQFNRLLIIPIGFSVLSILGFYIKAIICSDLKKYAMHTKKEVEKLKEQEKYNREAQKREFLREYDAKIKPMYLEAKNLFCLLMKQRKVHSYEVADLKKILNERLGKYADHYHNYKFKNDAHEIYTKMKNFHLNEYDWELILNFIHGLEANEPIKREKKVKEVANE